MEDGSIYNDSNDRKGRGEVYSKTVRAGKRTYFFDVKSTRRSDYYLTITESKKRFNKDGKYYFEKHKIFLYREDFEKFTDGLNEVLNFINETSPEISMPMEEDIPESVTGSYTDVDFDDLEEN